MKLKPSVRVARKAKTQREREGWEDERAEQYEREHEEHELQERLVRM